MDRKDFFRLAIYCLQDEELNFYFSRDTKNSLLQEMLTQRVNENAVEALLDAANPNTAQDGQGTRILLEQFHHLNAMGQSCLHVAVMSDWPEHMIVALLNTILVKNLHAAGDDDWAALERNNAIAELLMAVDSVNGGLTILYQAAAFGYVNLFRLVLERASEVMTEQQFEQFVCYNGTALGDSVFHYLVKQYLMSAKEVEAYTDEALEEGLVSSHDKDKEENGGYTPSPKKQTVRMSASAMLSGEHLENVKRKTYLLDMVSMMFSVIDVKILEKCMAVKNHEQDTLIHLLVKDNREDLQALLLDVSTQQDLAPAAFVQDKYGNTPLHYAGYHGNKDLAWFLLTKADKMYIVDNYAGDNFLHAADKERHYSFIDSFVNSDNDTIRRAVTKFDYPNWEKFSKVKRKTERMMSGHVASPGGLNEMEEEADEDAEFFSEVMRHKSVMADTVAGFEGAEFATGLPRNTQMMDGLELGSPTAAFRKTGTGLLLNGGSMPRKTNVLRGGGSSMLGGPAGGNRATNANGLLPQRSSAHPQPRPSNIQQWDPRATGVNYHNPKSVNFSGNNEVAYYRPTQYSLSP